MRVHLAVDNALELVAAGLLIAGVAVVVGLGAALLCAGVIAAVIAEFSWTGKVWTVGVPSLSRDARQQRAVRRQLRDWQRSERERMHAVSAEHPLDPTAQLDPDKHTDVRTPPR